MARPRASGPNVGVGTGPRVLMGVGEGPGVRRVSVGREKGGSGVGEGVGDGAGNVEDGEGSGGAGDRRGVGESITAVSGVTVGRGIDVGVAGALLGDATGEAD
jgi:hypothetical protein